MRGDIMFKFFYSKKGFTLTELLICVIILAIISGVAVPIFDKKQKKQKVEECIRNCQLIESTIKEVMYGMVDNGKKQEYFVEDTIWQKSSPTYGRIKDRGESHFGCEKYQSSITGVTYSKKCCILLSTSFANGTGSIATITGGCIRAEDRESTKTHLKRINYDGFTDDSDDYFHSGENRYLHAIYGGSTNEFYTYLGFALTNVASECVTIGNIRGGYRYNSSLSYSDGCKYGAFLKKKALADKPLTDYLANGEIPICPFEKGQYYVYYILFDGTVICGCKKCLKAKYDYGYTELT